MYNMLLRLFVFLTVLNLSKERRYCLCTKSINWSRCDKLICIQMRLGSRFPN
jgi:hypothetical protein